MTEREKHIEMAQRLGLVGMRPHLDGIYIDALAAFAKLVADDARATHELFMDSIKASVKRIRDNAKLALSSDDYKEVDLPHMRSVFEHVMIESMGQETASETYKLGLSLRMLDVFDMAEKARAASALPEGMAIVPVKPTPEMIAAALPHAMRESDEDKYRAIGEIICIWDEMLAAAKEKGE